MNQMSRSHCFLLTVLAFCAQLHRPQQPHACSVQRVKDNMLLVTILVQATLEYYNQSQKHERKSQNVHTTHVLVWICIVSRQAASRLTITIFDVHVQISRKHCYS